MHCDKKILIKKFKAFRRIVCTCKRFHVCYSFNHQYDKTNWQSRMDNPDNIGHKTQNVDKQNKKHNTENQNDKQHGPHQRNRG